jgi:antagonist of KipI
MLVGNDPREAVIEIHFPASVILFTRPALIALGGADFSASINGEAIPTHHPVIVGKNDVLQFHQPLNGARAYLAVAGGLLVEPWLGSCSTHLKANAGGHKGRQLMKDDELILKAPNCYPICQSDFIVLPWQADTHWVDQSKEILVLPGNEWVRLSTESKENFTMTSFVITQQSDRMGFRLNNIPLPVMNKEEIVSSAVSYGTVQLLPDGKLIILMADHQTTGGYPRIAHVISAHHSRLAQLRPGDKVHFSITDMATAEELLVKQQLHLHHLQTACTYRLEEYFHASRH